MLPEALIEAAAQRYRGAGRFYLQIARSKLRHDPVFAMVLGQGLLPACGRLYDLGCGQGILLALLSAAREEFAARRWPPRWPPPPALDLHGIERRTDRARAATTALAGQAEIHQDDLRAATLRGCDAIVVFDVFLYLPPADQHAILAACRGRLAADGILLLREADAHGGAAFHITRAAECAAELARGRWPRLHYRSAGQWKELMKDAGFEVASVRADAGTPFANTLHVCRRRA